MITSGLSAISTDGDSAVDLIAASEQIGMRRIVMINEEALPGFFSLDGGKTYCRWPDGAGSIDLDNLSLVAGQAIKFKRDPGGTDVTALFAWGY